MKKFVLLLFLLSSKIIFSQNIAVNTTGTAAASTNMFEVTQASTTNNTVGIFASHTGAATNAYAIWAQATGATNKYAIVVPSSGGSVGIGTTTPSELLHVDAGSEFINGEGQGLIVDAAGLKRAGLMKYVGYEAMYIGQSVTPSTVSIRLGRWTGGTINNPTTIYNDLVIHNNGYVGIQTTSPQAPIHLYGASASDVWQTYGVNSAVNTDGLNFGYSGATFGAGTSFLNAHSATAANGKVYFMINWTTRMNINNSGYVGIGLGNTSPSRAYVEQSGLIGNTAAMFGSGNSGISFIANWPTIYFNGYWNAGPKSMASGYGGNFCLDPTTGNFIWRTTNNPAAADATFTETQQMTLLNNGNFGIGTASPLGKLHISGGYTTSGLTANAGLYINGVTASPNSAQFIWGDNTGWKIHFGTDNGGSFLERMTIVDQGSVGIGTTSPVTKLVIWGAHPGAGAGTGASSDAPSQTVIPDGSGGATYLNDWPAGWGGGLATWDIAGATTWMSGYSTRSDKRFKKEIQSISDSKNDFINKFMQLRPVSYFINAETLQVDDPQRKRFGFIANEIENIFPNLVINAGQPDSIARGLEYDGFIPVLVMMSQEHQQQIKAQQKIIEEQQKAIEKLTEEVEKLKAKK
jgi:hypothetical protein